MARKSTESRWFQHGGQCEKHMSSALATIKSLHYNNELVYSFEEFSWKILQACRDLEGTGEEMTEFLKVKPPLEKVLITQPHAEVAKSYVRQNFWVDIDGAITHLGAEFADMFADAIAYKQGRSGVLLEWSTPIEWHNNHA